MDLAPDALFGRRPLPGTESTTAAGLFDATMPDHSQPSASDGTTAVLSRAPVPVEADKAQ